MMHTGMGRHHGAVHVQEEIRPAAPRRPGLWRMHALSARTGHGVACVPLPVEGDLQSDPRPIKLLGARPQSCLDHGARIDLCAKRRFGRSVIRGSYPEGKQ